METIYLFDIERAILNIEQIRQCKAVVSEINQEKHHVAHISLDSGANIDDVLCKIKAHCEKALSQNHFPKLIKIHNDALPVSLSGKLNIDEMKNSTNDLIRL